MELDLRINGIVKSLDVAPNESLLTMLRREGYCSVKQGCETGECGACTVLVDGVPRPTCVMLATQAGGCTLNTVESLSSAQELHPLQEAFIEVGAIQCGFCTPGMVLSAYALLKRTPRPTENEVRDALSGNLCRCTGYVKPVQAVLRAAALLHGETAPPLAFNIIHSNEGNIAHATGKSYAVVPDATGKMRTVTVGAGTATGTNARPDSLQVVGKPVCNVDGSKLVTGKAAFADDITLRGVLHGRVLTSPHAHAVIRDIDVSEATALSGVHAVLTYRAVPRVPYSSVKRSPADIGPYDQYCLDDIVRYVGDRVAAVAAETPEIAEQALSLIQVEYDVLPALLDPRQALEPGVPPLHPESESHGIRDASRNVAARVRSDVGDVERGFAEADFVIEGEYLIPQVQQVPIENHAVITYFDEDDYLVVRTNTQTPHHVRRTLAPLIGLPMRRIRVVKSSGGFGEKQEIVLEDICALLTVATQRPVRMTYARADEFRCSPGSHQQIVRMKTGVKGDGTIVANQMLVLASTGAYGTHPLTSRTTSESLSLYPCPHTRFAAEVVYTTLPPARAFRDDGTSSEFFALECHMDEIAKRLNMDALELRRKNWIKASDKQVGTQFIAPLQVVAEKLNWSEKRGKGGNGRIRRGIGAALSLHGSATGDTGTSGAIIKLNEDGSFDVFASITDGGIGSDTMLAQIAAEVLGVPLEDVLLHSSETSVIPSDTSRGASTTLYNSGGAVKRAAESARQQLLAVAGRMLNVLPEALKVNGGTITAPNSQTATVAQVAFYALYVEGRHLIATASWKGQHPPISFAVHGAEVEVDVETGSVRVLKTITAVDAGSVINPMIAQGQIQGSVTLALGAAMCEEMQYDQRGVLLTPNLYHIYNTLDMPEMHTYLVKTNDSSAPFGAKAVAEVSMIGMTPAIANAVSDALGVRIRQIPLTPERVLRAIHAQSAN